MLTRDGLLWAIVALALVLRLAFLAASSRSDSRCEDCKFYDEVGWNVASGRGFVGGFASETFAGPSPLGADAPEAGMGPVYPLFVAAIFRTAGHSPSAVYLAQAFVGAATVLLVFNIGLSFGRRPAIAAALITAAAPALIEYTALLLTETLFAFVLSLTVWLMIRAAHTARVASGAAAGLSLGVCALLRSECLVLIPLFPIVLWRCAPVRRLQIAVTMTALACATVGIWTVRNQRVFHEPIIVSAASGEILWIATQGWREWRFDDPELHRLVGGQDYVGQNRILGRVAIENIRQDPMRYLRYCLRRIPEFWISSHTSYVDGLNERFSAYARRGAYGRVMVKSVLLALDVAVLALAAAGIVNQRRIPDAWFILTPIVAIAVVHVFLYASPRYQVPILPLLFVFAGVTIAGSVTSSRQSPSSRSRSPRDTAACAGDRPADAASGSAG